MKLGSHGFCCRVRNGLSDYGKRTGIFESQSIIDQFLRRFLVAGLLPHSSELMQMLGRTLGAPLQGDPRL